MLKVYLVKYWVSIDGSSWKEVGHNSRSLHKITEEELDEELILDNITFEEAYNYFSQNSTLGFFSGTTFFKKTPQIKIYYSHLEHEINYKTFKSLSYKKTFEEIKDFSTEWLMMHTTVKDFLKYLKDRW